MKKFVKLSMCVDNGGEVMNESGEKKSIILDFLEKLRGQEIEVTMGIGIWTGKIVEFDHAYMVFESPDGVSLLKIEEIISIDWAPKLEIVAL